MQVDDWDVLVAAVEHTSLNRASQVLNLSQPALSRRLAKLEDELGVTLFERRGKRLELTPVGRLCYEHALELRRLERKFRRSLNEYRQGVRHSLTIGASLTTLQSTLPDLISMFTREFPHAEVKALTGKTHEVVAMVKDKKVDLGLVASALESPDLQCVPLFDDHLSLVLPAGHPLLIQAGSGAANESPAVYEEPSGRYGTGSGRGEPSEASGRSSAPASAAGGVWPTVPPAELANDQTTAGSSLSPGEPAADSMSVSPDSRNGAANDASTAPAAAPSAGSSSAPDALPSDTGLTCPGNMVSSGSIVFPIGVLTGLPVILFSRGTWYRVLVDELFDRYGVVPDIRMEIDSFEAIVRMVSSCGLATLLPQSYLRQVLLDDNGLVVAHVPELKQTTRTTSLIYLNTAPFGPDVLAWIARARSHFAARVGSAAQYGM